jgi:drug/metabolite transporter (DMT)-like permease
VKPSYLIILLVMNFFWAGVYSAYKFIDHDLPTGAIVTLRFGLAALCLLFAWPWLPGPSPRGKDLICTCLLGLMLFVLGQRLQVYGNYLGRAGDSSVLMAFEPLITSVIAGIFLRERIGPRRWFGFGLGLFGVALLHGVWQSDFRWAGLSASAIFVSSFVCEGLYSVMGKPIVSRAGVMKMLTISLAVGSAANLLIDGGSTWHAARGLPIKSWLILIAMATVCTAIGYSLWFMVIRECPVNVAALTVFAQSVFGVMIAAIWLHEPLRWGQFFGCLVIVLGLMLGLSRQIQKPPDDRLCEANLS